MLGFDEKNLDTPVASWAQRLLGVVLLLAVALAIWYAVTSPIEQVWSPPTADDPVWISVLVLICMPFLLNLTAHLLAGKMETVELLPPVRLILSGALLIVGGVSVFFFSLKYGQRGGPALLAGLLGGIWAIRIGLRRLNRRGPQS